MQKFYLFIIVSFCFCSCSSTNDPIQNMSFSVEEIQEEVIENPLFTLQLMPEWKSTNQKEMWDNYLETLWMPNPNSISVKDIDDFVIGTIERSDAKGSIMGGYEKIPVSISINVVNLQNIDASNMVAYIKTFKKKAKEKIKKEKYLRLSIRESKIINLDTREYHSMDAEIKHLLTSSSRGLVINNKIFFTQIKDLIFVYTISYTSYDDLNDAVNLIKEVKYKIEK